MKHLGVLAVTVSIKRELGNVEEDALRQTQILCSLSPRGRRVI